MAQKIIELLLSYFSLRCSTADEKVGINSCRYSYWDTNNFYKEPRLEKTAVITMWNFHNLPFPILAKIFVIWKDVYIFQEPNEYTSKGACGNVCLYLSVYKCKNVYVAVENF